MCAFISYDESKAKYLFVVVPFQIFIVIVFEARSVWHPFASEKI